jgi:hypothetical protein
LVGLAAVGWTAGVQLAIIIPAVVTPAIRINSRRLNLLLEFFIRSSPFGET